MTGRRVTLGAGDPGAGAAAQLTHGRPVKCQERERGTLLYSASAGAKGILIWGKLGPGGPYYSGHIPQFYISSGPGSARAVSLSLSLSLSLLSELGTGKNQ